MNDVNSVLFFKSQRIQKQFFLFFVTISFQNYIFSKEILINDIKIIRILSFIFNRKFICIKLIWEFKHKSWLYSYHLCFAISLTNKTFSYESLYECY